MRRPELASQFQRRQGHLKPAARTARGVTGRVFLSPSEVVACGKPYIVDMDAAFGTTPWLLVSASAFLCKLNTNKAGKVTCKAHAKAMMSQAIHENGLSAIAAVGGPCMTTSITY